MLLNEAIQRADVYSRQLSQEFFVVFDDSMPDGYRKGYYHICNDVDLDTCFYGVNPVYSTLEGLFI